MKTTAQRMRSTDLEWVASAVDINRETGGNLAEVLENVTGTIRGARIACAGRFARSLRRAASP